MHDLTPDDLTQPLAVEAPPAGSRTAAWLAVVVLAATAAAGAIVAAVGANRTADRIDTCPDEELLGQVTGGAPGAAARSCPSGWTNHVPIILLLVSVLGVLVAFGTPFWARGLGIGRRRAPAGPPPGVESGEVSPAGRRVG